MGRSGSNPVFGLTSGARRGNFRGRGSYKGGSNTHYTKSRPAGGNKEGSSSSRNGGGATAYDDGTQEQERLEEVKIWNEIDEKLGFSRWEGSEGDERVGWLVNMHQTTIDSTTTPGQALSAIELYFVQDDGSQFKCHIPFEPYFLIGCRLGTETIVEEYLLRLYPTLTSVVRIPKTDLHTPNHLLTPPATYLKLSFSSQNDLYAVRREILPLAKKNESRRTAVDVYAEMVALSNLGHGDDEEVDGNGNSLGAKSKEDPSECILDCREFDVNYYLRVAIDLDIRVGLWYTIMTPISGMIKVERIVERVKRADPVVLAFDIETTKAPLKFPDWEAGDCVMMISYMIDGQGYLITNRQIVSEDIEDFEYTPKEDYIGEFEVFNEEDEASLIRRFFSHVRSARPTIISTYNGDSFDFPFLEARANVHGISMYTEIGFRKDSEGEYKSRGCSHMDCFRWVKRDSYLPQGSQGLKAVTTYKLGYAPLELDPELMTPYASSHPQILAQYSVSDAVATYYLYMKYVNPFVFSLCNIIPLNPDEVLRKGTGTLCETLLMVEAFKAEIIMPNRYEEPTGNMYEGHLLISETYVGGHVEALEAGVFRADIPTHFKVEPSACQQLIDELDAALEFSIKEEAHMNLEDVVNYAEVKGQIQAALEELRDNPARLDKPLIYHLDVAAMYPNIMLSNRLQPDSIVDEAMCATCDYNRPDKTCDRRMDWAWRGEYFPAKRDEFNMVKNALDQEMFPPKWPDGPKRRFVDLNQTEQAALLQKRLGDYSRKVYRKNHDTKVVTKEAIVCQRENPFYIDTVRAFRDRRYEYKGLHKTWKKNLDNAVELADVQEAKGMVVIYDSLQLAHKCILNSFYGYVMRKGARWYSMEMAGITCLTGATIIQLARQLVEQIGRPLELDTDGIWCMLPGTFPENFSFELKNGKKLGISYPCTMLNHLVHAKFTNHQYHELVDKDTGKYEIRSENSIFFELDGPYKAMVLPSSKEEDKLLKKRYAVFNFDNSLAELKGFEVKRRGELQLIKIFQTSIFEKFLLGTTTEECYAAVATVANQWLDVLQSKGSSLGDSELVELISENRSMSKTLQEYGAQKSTSISTARRLAEFLGDGMVKDKGLACKFIISAKPHGAPVTDRAVPIAIFDAEEGVKTHFLKKWLKDNSMTAFDLRSVLDWEYYTERLGSVIQKLITIPAALQKVSNPVPRIRHPDWLHKRVAAKEDKFQQHKLTDMFAKMKANAPPPADLEDFGKNGVAVIKPKTATVKKAEAAAKRRAEDLAASLPDPTVDYSAWIRVMRKKWKIKREDKKAAGGIKSSMAGNSITSIFQRATTAMNSTDWDVVQISPASRPGEFNLWLHINNSFQKVRLRIPRQFYLNLRSVPPKSVFQSNYLAEAINRTLPRNHPSPNLYQITVSEEAFVAGETHFSNLINNPNVDGVYELQIPLVVRALLHLGLSCTPEASTKGGLNKGLDRGFDLAELTATAPHKNKKYLNQGFDIRYTFLYHSYQDGRHLIGLLTPGSKAKILSIDNARTRQQITHLPKFYADKYSKTPQDILSNGVFPYDETVEFDVTYYGTETAGFRALSRELANLSTQRTRPTMVVIFSEREQHYYESRSPALNNFPVVMMHSSKETGSPLMWLNNTTRRMIAAYLQCSTWLKNHIEMAKHHGIPLGNIEADAPLFLADLDFARRLIANDMVLWWSPGNRPDLGGREEDANSPGAIDELSSPEFSNSGCYSNVTMKINIQDLAINSILQSSMVNEMEGSGSGSMAFDSASHNLDDYSSGTAHVSLTIGDAVLSTQTFAILKSMVKGWYLDKARMNGGDTPVADILVNNFYRWISSPASNLFDQGFHRFLHGLMKKTFLQLLAEFKRLGSKVIYADFTQIVLLTSKPSTANTLAYARYLLMAANSHELFRHLSFEIVQYWEFLLWMDVQNHGGVPVLPEEAAKDLIVGEHLVDLEWNIQSFLPPGLQRDFEIIIGSFIDQMYRAKRSVTDNSRTPLRAIQTPSALGTVPSDAQKEKEVAFGRKLIAKKFTRRMLDSVLKIIERQKEAHIDEYIAEELAFPNLPGSHLHPTNPALEFVKTICAVFALSKDLSVEVQILKRNLLDLVGVREFADEAIFKNPCEVLKLPNVICTQCLSSKDLDLCREPDRLPYLAEVTVSGEERTEWVLKEPRNKTWMCPNGHMYDRTDIEMKLVEIVQKLVLLYQLQDLTCSKCKQIRDDNLSLNCRCGSAYITTVNKGELRKKLALIKSVAEYHELAMLDDYVHDCVQKW